ncbi:MAG: peptide chain release factor N(5)-glutamine methyltransferase [Methylococcaceae bacterium]|nr:peptide chain release factor N(5)-glutamine methyltransferase [Methylococcaceae bacterium]
MTDIQTALSTATKLLKKTSDSASLDTEVLLCHVLNKSRSHLRAWPEKKLQEKDKQQFLQLIKQRQQGLPIAYIIGSREFWSRDFKVNNQVLIPRPDTELLIELSLRILADAQKTSLLDLGTGSGIVGITLAAERPNIDVIATDLSVQALTIAKENAATHQIKNIHFIQSNWFAQIPGLNFDLIVSNPPYIANNDPHLSQGDIRFEPKSALTSDEQGLSDIKKISAQAHNFLTHNGTLAIEHGFDQQKAVQTIFKSFNYHNIKTHSDLSGNPRVTTGQWKTK